MKAGEKAKYQSEPKVAITSTLIFVYHNDDNFNNLNPLVAEKIKPSMIPMNDEEETKIQMNPIIKKKEAKGINLN